MMGFSLPVVALLAANLVPLYGVWFWGWGVFELIFLYWCENVIIGVYNLFKIAMARGEKGEKLFSIPFFTIHYGMFAFVHGVFVVIVFGPELAENAASPFAVFTHAGNAQGFSLALLAMALSHATAFYWHYVRNNAYLHRSVKSLMDEPYRRVVVLHLTILVGGFIVQVMREPLGALVAMIVIKLYVDMIALRMSRKRSQHGQSGGGADADERR